MQLHDVRANNFQVRNSHLFQQKVKPALHDNVYMTTVEISKHVCGWVIATSRSLWRNFSSNVISNSNWTHLL